MQLNLIAALAPVVTGDGGWFWDSFVSYGPVAVTWALAALAAVGSWVLARLGAQKAVRSIFEELGMHARDVVQEVWQVYVEGIKAGRADGYLTVAERESARAMAIAKLKQRLTVRKLIALGGGWLTRLFAGSKWQSRVEDIIGGAVETAVAESKRDARSVGLTTSGTKTKNDLVSPSLMTSPPPSGTAEAAGGPPSSPR